MKFKKGDRVKNIINGRTGIVFKVLEQDCETDLTNGVFKRVYLIEYTDEPFYVWHSIVEIDRILEILDEKEKEYLTNLVKPYINQGFSISISKKRSCIDFELEFISITLTKKSNNHLLDGKTQQIMLPYFKSNTMYQGMKTDKKYTLEQLNIK